MGHKDPLELWVQQEHLEEQRDQQEHLDQQDRQEQLVLKDFKDFQVKIQEL
jgi:hypothetical protein